VKKLIVFTGAGMSAESGIPTFRGSDGLWENHRIEDVATPGAWERDFELVLRFYNLRRKAVLEAKPNRGHEILAELERNFEVAVITQNIDDLHERAGSTRVLHLHGEIVKSRSTVNPKLIYPVAGWEIKTGETCELGSQLRPHIVWFGESVPMMDDAIDLVQQADVFIVVGTSLQVYPAASLVEFVPTTSPKFLIDPGKPESQLIRELSHIAKGAGEGLDLLYPQLLQLSK
jgi:NAD-dependent deacetylase